MVVRLAGRSTDTIAEDMKTFRPMVVSPSGSVMDVSELAWNAL